MGKPDDTLRPLQTIAAALILAPILSFGAMAAVRFLRPVPVDIPVVLYVSIGLALLSPVLAGAMRQSLLDRFAGEPLSVEKRRASVIVPFAILEMAALLCGIAFFLTPTYWPLLAVLVPLGAMALWFPRQ